MIQVYIGLCHIDGREVAIAEKCWGPSYETSQIPKNGVPVYDPQRSAVEATFRKPDFKALTAEISWFLG